MIRRPLALLLLPLLAATASADIRDRIKAAGRPAEGTRLSAAQASDITLTFTVVEVRPIQDWVRLSGTVDASGRVLTALAAGPGSGQLAAGQRARVFHPDSKSSMFQARIEHVERSPAGVRVLAQLPQPVNDRNARYVMEVVTELGEFLSVPNEALIEEGDHQVVYLQAADGSFQPRTVTTGVQGERYTQILDGLATGQQVVTTGSFFVDAEYKMRGGT